MKTKDSAVGRTGERKQIGAWRAFLRGEDGSLVNDERGEAYIGEAVKILIAVVIGALLLTLIYTLMKDEVFATVSAKIRELFNYSGT